MNFSALSNFDYLILSIIGLSMLFAFWKGFIRSFLYFSGWVLAAMLMIDNYPRASAFFSMHIKNKVIVDVVSTAGVFFSLLIIFAIVNKKIIDASKELRGGAIDRSLGACFGLVRGCVIGCLIFWSLIIIFSAWDDREEPEWLSEAKSYKLLKMGTDYMVAAIASDPERNKILKLIDKNGKFNVLQKEKYERLDIEMESEYEDDSEGFVEEEFNKLKDAAKEFTE
jgi:membrane protein required for colicin V production